LFVISILGIDNYTKYSDFDKKTFQAAPTFLNKIKVVGTALTISFKKKLVQY